MFRIPQIYHFAYGCHDREEPFSLVHYLCLESCRQINRAERMFVHCHHLPHGPWWERIREHLTCNQVPAGRPLGGHRGACTALEVDRIRLEQLLIHGGVSADIDSLFIEPLPAHLFAKEFVLGEDPAGLPGCTATPGTGLMMAAPGAPFCRAWREALPTAFGASRDSATRRLAAELLITHPDWVHLEPARTFYALPATGDRWQQVLTGRLPELTGAAWLHLGSLPRHRTPTDEPYGLPPGGITEPYLRQVDTAYARLVRPFLPPPHPIPVDGRVSVVIPTHNRPTFLRTAVASALAQSVPPLEVLIVDDGSQPGEEARIQSLAELSPRVKLLRFAVNRGCSEARNHGFAGATGDYIHFLDDDDVVLPWFYESALKHLADTGADIAVCAFRFFRGAAAQICDTAAGLSLFNGALLEKDPVGYLLREPMAINAALCRREALAPYRFPANVRRGEDTLFWLDVAGSGATFVAIAAAGAFVRCHDGNTTRNKRLIPEHDAFLRQLLKHPRLQHDPAAVSVHLQLIRNAAVTGRAPPRASLAALLSSPWQTTSTALRFLRRKAVEARCLAAITRARGIF